MNRGVVYLDSSALLKLIFEEDETHALGRFLVDHPLRCCSVVGRIEVLRIAQLVEDDHVVAQADDVLSRIHLVNLDALTIARAIDVNPRVLRALDAIHLGTALSMESDLEGMVAYDHRLADAARSAGLTVWAPA